MRVLQPLLFCLAAAAVPALLMNRTATAEQPATEDPPPQSATETEPVGEPPEPGQPVEPAAEATDSEPMDEPAEADPLGLSAADPDNPGQGTLDRAMDLKLGAQDLRDLNEVVDLLDEAIEEGLDADNTDFAERVLAATLTQRAEALAQMVLSQPMPNPQVDPRGLQWLQVRSRSLTDLLRVVAIEDDNFEAWLLIGRLQSLPRGDQSETRRALTNAIRLAEASREDPDSETIDPKIVAQCYALRGAAEKDDEDRLSDFTKAIETDPSKAEYLLLRAQAHRAAKRPAECLADIDRAIELAPENPKVYELKALALSMQGRNEEAIEAFNQASELAPQLLSPYQYRGELYSQLGKLDEAIAQLDKALEVSPNNLASLLIRAQLLLGNDQPDRALKDIDRILGQRPGLVQAHQMKASALDALDRTDEAIAWLERLVGIDPSKPALQMQLAVFYVEKQMAPEAIETLSRVLEIDAGSAIALRLRGDMHLFAGQHDEAVADFQRALDIDPDDSGVLNNYAWTLATSPFEEVRDGERAVELATKACEITQYGAPHILSTLGAALAESGRFEEAVARSEEAVAKSQELGAEGEYDGQLEAELNCYRAGQPWRELQKLSVSGPANETADQLKDVTLESLGDLPINDVEGDETKVLPEPPKAPTTRSLDF